MPIKGKFDISDNIDVLLGTIPGPQDGETIAEYKSRVNADIATIVMASAAKLSEVNAFIEKNSDIRIEDGEQIYSAVRRSFVDSDGS